MPPDSLEIHLPNRHISPTAQAKKVMDLLGDYNKKMISTRKSARVGIYLVLTGSKLHLGLYNQVNAWCW